MDLDPKTSDRKDVYRLLQACVLPRPIAWVSSLDADATANLAPFSFFMIHCTSPPIISISTARREDQEKDTRRNIVETGEFVHNFTTWDTREAMNESSATTSMDVDEMAMVGLTPVPSKLVKAPRVKETPIHFECKLLQTVDLPNANQDNAYTVVFGEVVGIHIDDAFILPSGQIDIAKLHPIGRMGYQDYTEVTGETVFTMERPGFRE